MHISEIIIYPIKSLKGISLDSATVEKRGLQYDRRWMLTNPDGNFMTQRENHRMAIIEVGINDQGLFATVDRFGTIELPLSPDTGNEQEVNIWGSVCSSEVYPAVTNEWFSDVLAMKCQLVFMPDISKRKVNQIFDMGEDIVSFADGYPLLVIGESSLDDLNSRLEHPVPMNRFRPNIVVAGSEPYEEDRWEKINVNGSIFRATKPCARCVVPTIDQLKGEVTGKEPLKTLASYRTAIEVIPDRFESMGMTSNAVLFGQNLIAENTGTTINVGDTVQTQNHLG